MTSLSRTPKATNTDCSCSLASTAVATPFCRLGFRRGRKVGSGLTRLLSQVTVALYVYPVALDDVTVCNRAGIFASAAVICSTRAYIS